MNTAFTIRSYSDSRDRAEVLRLWKRVFSYDSPHNRPELSIDRKLRANDDLFFVAADSQDQVLGTIMAGYDGHRGWLYSLAVTPEFRGRKIGSALVQKAETALLALGCVKVNLQILPGNAGVAAFYQKLGFVIEERISMGKRLPAK